MQMVNIVGRFDSINNVIEAFCRFGNLHPEDTAYLLEGTNGFNSIDQINPKRDSLDRINNILMLSNIPTIYTDYDDLNLTETQINEYSNNFFNSFNLLQSQKSGLEQLISSLDQAIIHLSQIKEMNIKLDDLFNCKFIKIRFGRLPIDSYQKLKAYDDNPFMMFFPTLFEKEYVFGVYFTPNSCHDEIDEIFTSLYFERFRISEQAHGTSTEAIQSLTKQYNEEQIKLTTVQNEMNELIKKEEIQLEKIYCYIKYQYESFELTRYAAKNGDNFYLVGWIAEQNITQFKAIFDEVDNVDCIFEDVSQIKNETKKSSNDENDNNLCIKPVSPPTLLKNSRFFNPFEEFVNMYGLPSYNEIDPTPLVAISYTLLFGIMFGDLGQGLTLAVIGYLLFKFKNMFLGRILIRTGISSAIFGVFYGSVFGYEEALNPFFNLIGLKHKPIEIMAPENTNIILGVAVGIGIIFIIIAIIMNIINGIKHKDAEKLFFGQNALAGLVLYISVILSAALLLLFNLNILSIVFVIFAIFIPLIIIFLREPLSKLVERKKDWIPENKVEFFVQNFFELFEIILSFVTNTISFVRVGAFALAHAGMMTVVFTLAHMLGNSPNIFVIIFGNVFVIIMEGLIVGIQILRLEFYEIFSRFFAGEGKIYKPAKIDYISRL
jgi:V/A-type H+-transporting ATPase subunit I